MKNPTRPLLVAFVAPCLLSAWSCGSVPTPDPGRQTTPQALPPGTLLDQLGRLDASDQRVGNAYSDMYQVPVTAGDRVVVGVGSNAFDPVLEVSPPTGGALVNDDYQASRQRSQLDFVATASGMMKIRVTSFNPQATGDYRVQALRIASTSAQPVASLGSSAAGAAAPTPAQLAQPVQTTGIVLWAFLAPGQNLDGALQQGDPTAPDGSFVDYISVMAVTAPLALHVTSTGAEAPRVIALDPQGQQLRPAADGSFALATTGTYRVQVLSPGPGRQASYTASLDAGAAGATQAYNVTHHAPPPAGSGTPVQLGQRVRGTLAASDTRLPTGETADVYLLNAAAGAPISVTLSSSVLDPYLLVVSPTGESWDNDDSGGTRNSALTFTPTQTGQYRIVATSYRAGETGAYELKVDADARSVAAGGPVAVLSPTGANPTPNGNATAAGAQVQQGTLAQGDTTLRSGEFVDNYTFNFAAGTPVQIQLSSSAFDPYLIVRAPSGGQQDNDDISPTDRNAGLSYTATESGPHTVMVTSYRAGEAGPYTLTVGGAGVGSTVPVPLPGAPPNPSPTPTLQPTAGWNTQQGALAAGDRTLQSGEFADALQFTWPAGQAVHLEARSTAFDTYLIVRAPSGHQEDNDDAQQGSTNAGLDLVTTESGQYTVTVTSYRPGETGPYELVVGTPGAGGLPTTPTPTPTPNPTPVAPTPTPNPTPVAPTPTPSGGRQITGTLARGDQTLRTGEFQDTHALTFQAGAAAQIRLTSSQFDPYLIIRTPSGRQLDNDDFTPGTRDAGVDIPLAEAGSYSVMVTSYRAGETGSYTLTYNEGTSSVPRPSPGPGPGPNPGPGPGPNPGPSAGGGRVFGLFAGITDYPGGINDLPECANDARKLAEALRNAGLLDPSRQVVLTDGQATNGAVRQAMAQMGAQMGPQDVFVFFYSGHGGQRQGSRDARELDGIDETIVLYDGEMVDDDLGQLFGGIHAGTSIVALDSCFSGGFAKDVITAPHRIGLFSSEEDVTSDIALQFQAGGYLSHFLRLAMQGDADSDPRDRVLTVGELTHFVWRQFGTQAADVRMSMGYQQLVVDRGAVGATSVLWAYR